MRICRLAFIVLPFFSFAQNQTQKALNAYADYANQSGEEITSVVKRIIEYYPQIDSKYQRAEYECPFQLDDYFITQVNALSKALPAAGALQVRTAFAELRSAEQLVDTKCKELDTYHKLEDYKKDNYHGARDLIAEIQKHVASYRNALKKLQLALENANKVPDASPLKAYSQTDKKILAIVESERKLLNEWLFNINEKVHTGWPVEKLKASIPVSEANLQALQGAKPELKYPASSMLSNFLDVFNSYIDMKRSALDDYNIEAKKSDKHSNDVYLDLINYFNGTLVADYNTFLQFSERDGYYGVKTIEYVPGFMQGANAETIAIDIKPFPDIPYPPLVIAKQSAPITQPTFDALTQFIIFINETYRQTSNLQSTLASFNATAAYFKSMESFERRAPMTFDLNDFKPPISSHQKTIGAAKSIDSRYVTTLTTQADVLFHVLVEMQNLGAALEIEVRERNYEKDHLVHVYEILEREGQLFKIWDAKKEKLYHDIRAVFDSYPPANPTSSWQLSGKALRELTDLDHDAVFLAKKFYQGDSAIDVPTGAIDAKIREVIASEYNNLKGVQKLGRSNGNCPYTPYEDIPETSRQLSERFGNMNIPSKKYSRYEDPYYRIIYLYNDVVADYNKFCELSKTAHHLPTVFQPERFDVKYPDVNGKTNNHAANETPTSSKRSQTSPENSQTPAQVSSNALKIQQTDSVYKTHRTDTVYIEKRDTIYLREPTENLRSMEGYATNNMVLLLDVSGSMNQPDKLPLLKESMLQMLSMMRQEDHVSIIIFAAKPKIVLKSVSFKEEQKIRKAVADLSSSGKTDGNAAIRMAYKIADENYVRGGNNRIILATDGVFTISDDTHALIDKFSKDDIFLSVFNFGKGMGASQSLEMLAKEGKGNYSDISKQNVEVKLINEAKAKRKK